MIKRLLGWIVVLLLAINLVRIGVAQSQGVDFTQIYFEQVLVELSTVNDNWLVIAYDLEEIVVSIKNTIPVFSEEDAISTITNILFPYNVVISIANIVVDFLNFVISALDFVFVLIGLPPIMSEPIMNLEEYIEFIKKANGW